MTTTSPPAVTSGIPGPPAGDLAGIMTTELAAAAQRAGQLGSKATTRAQFRHDIDLTIGMYRIPLGADLTTGQAAWLLTGLKDIAIRDYLWGLLRTRDHRDAHRRLLTGLCAHAPAGYAAAPATLLAVLAWQDGNRALAHATIDQALTDDPGYKVALMFRQLLNDPVSQGPQS